MKLKIFLLIISFIILNAFEVEYIKIYTQYIVPKQEAIKITTKKEGLSFPFPFIKTKDGYILYGDIDNINMWLDNNFYTSDDTLFKRVKFNKINYDLIQYKIINDTKRIYKTCNIKKIVFLTPNKNKIITKPSTIRLKYKIKLDCK